MNVGMKTEHEDVIPLDPPQKSSDADPVAANLIFLREHLSEGRFELLGRRGLAIQLQVTLLAGRTELLQVQPINGLSLFQQRLAHRDQQIGNRTRLFSRRWVLGNCHKVS